MATAQNKLPQVSIVGCPNVGKSTLFNRIIRQRKAISYRERGTTRDRITHEATFKNKKFLLTDTGGFVQKEEGGLTNAIKAQIKKAILDSEILLLVCDGQMGLSPQDLEFAPLLRKANKKIFLVISKVDNEKIKERIWDFYKLGLDKPYPVSALHNLGIEDLLEDIVKGLPDVDLKEEKSTAIKVAVIGRPNVGKSSFLNTILKEERVVVDKMPGTTRDAVDTYFKDGVDEFIFIDTAGIRHKKKIKEAVDVYGMLRTKEVIKKSNVALVLIDGYEGLVLDDLKILELVIKEGKCCILCVNKWDLAEGVPLKKYNEMIYKRARFLKNYPIIFTSAKTGYNVFRSLSLIKEVTETSRLEIPTPKLNKLLNFIKSSGPFAPRKNRVKLHYGVQIKTKPPTFLIFADNPHDVSETHKNYIENELRKSYNFMGVPIKFEFRPSKK